MSELTQSIKALYQDTLSDGEVELAKDNLVGFFKLLQEIDTRLHQRSAERTKQKDTCEQTEANLPQSTPQNATQSILQSKTTRTNKQTIKK
jgi:hypothetical protein